MGSNASEEFRTSLVSRFQQSLRTYGDQRLAELTAGLNGVSLADDRELASGMALATSAIHSELINGPVRSPSAWATPCSALTQKQPSSSASTLAAHKSTMVRSESAPADPAVPTTAWASAANTRAQRQKYSRCFEER